MPRSLLDVDALRAEILANREQFNAARRCAGPLLACFDAVLARPPVRPLDRWGGAEWEGALSALRATRAEIASVTRSSAAADEQAATFIARGEWTIATMRAMATSSRVTIEFVRRSAATILDAMQTTYSMLRRERRSPETARALNPLLTTMREFIAELRGVAGRAA